MTVFQLILKLLFVKKYIQETSKKIYSFPISKVRFPNNPELPDLQFEFQKRVISFKLMKIDKKIILSHGLKPDEYSKN